MSFALARTNLGDEFVQSDREFQPRAFVRSSVSFRILKDTDLMPFGAFSGQPLSEVPASYLDRLRHDKTLERRNPGLWHYITETAAKAIDLELDHAERAGSSR